LQISETLYKIKLDITVYRANYAVCLFVCLSVTRRYSVETAKHIFILFTPSGSPTILFFDSKQCDNIPTGTP